MISDHRACFVDFNENALHDSDNPKCDPPQERILTTKNKKASDSFKRQVMKEFKAANIASRIQMLDKAMKEKMMPEHISTLEALDEEIDQILKMAEANIPKNLTPWWSPTLHRAHSAWQYRKSNLSFVKNNIEDSQDILGQLQQEVPDDTDIFQGDQHRSILAQLNTAQRALHECHQDSKALRMSHPQSRVAEEAEKGNSTVEKASKSTIKSETMSKMCCALRTHTHTHPEGGAPMCVSTTNKRGGNCLAKSAKTTGNGRCSVPPK